MKNQVTIVPDDKLIIVDGEALIFDWQIHDTNIHAIQWKSEKGHVEYEDETINQPANYETDVAPYVALFEAEKDRLEEEANRPPTPEELKQRRITEIKRELENIDAKSARSMRALLNNTATDADRDFLANMETQAGVLRAELATLEASNEPV